MNTSHSSFSGRKKSFIFLLTTQSSFAELLDLLIVIICRESFILRSLELRQTPCRRFIKCLRAVNHKRLAENLFYSSTPAACFSFKFSIFAVHGTRYKLIMIGMTSRRVTLHQRGMLSSTHCYEDNAIKSLFDDIFCH